MSELRDRIRARQASVTPEGGRAAAAAFVEAEYRRDTQPFYTMMADYLLAHGYTRGSSDEYWYHPTSGVRSFEVCVVWQLTQEGHYGDRVSGWKQIGVPVPVAAA